MTQTVGKIIKIQTPVFHMKRKNKNVKRKDVLLF